jgi:hypothetical protein
MSLTHQLRRQLARGRREILSLTTMPQPVASLDGTA